jgi:hypothetical protein
MCPRGTLDCTAASHRLAAQAKHDCCGKCPALRATDCCCGASHQQALQLDSSATRSLSPKLAVMPAGMAGALAATACRPSALAHGVLRRGHGLPPPDTLLTQHTRLLL